MDVFKVDQDIIDVNAQCRRDQALGRVTKARQMTFLEAFEWQKTHRIVGCHAKYKTPYYIEAIVEDSPRDYILDYSRPDKEVFGRYFHAEGASGVCGGERATLWIATALNGKPL